MKASVNTVCILIIVAIVGAWLAFRTLVVRVPLGMVGVRTLQLAVSGGAKGVVPKDFRPGFHRDLGPIDRWELFDATVQTLELTKDPKRGDRAGRDDVQIVSADGNRVAMDITVKYRIKDGEAHELYQKLGAGDAYKRIVRNESLDTFRIAYGELRTEEFYDPVRREECTSVSLHLVRQRMEPRHVDVLEVLVRDVQFEERYERKIRDKKLADQDIELNKSKEKAAEMSGITNVIRKETQAMIKVINSEKEGELVKLKAETDKQIAQIKAEAEKYATETRADADLVAAELTAKGTLLEREAEANGETLRAKALQGSGGANYVALEAARNLDVEDITVSTQSTPFLDVEAMAGHLGAREK